MCVHIRYLDPDTSILLSELKNTTNKKFHKLNKAICGLVSVCACVCVCVFVCGTYLILPQWYEY